MARGGARDGAGRPRGAVNRTSSAVAEKALADGLTPLDVMLANMRFYHQEADRVLAELLAGGVPQVSDTKTMPDQEPDPERDDEEGPPIATEEDPAGEPEVSTGADKDPNQSILEALKQVLGLRQLAGVEAARAAPYIHARQGFASEQAQGDDEIPLAERLKEYQRRDALKAAGANVVDLNEKR